MSWSSPGKNTTVRQVSLQKPLLVVDTFTFFRTKFLGTFHFLKKKKKNHLVIKIWQLLILKMLRGRRVLLYIHNDH